MSSESKSKLLAKRTAFSIGLDESQFTITDVEKGFLRTDFRVRANNGNQYRCYMTGALIVSSDVLCSKNGEQSCNALLKAAGKC